MGVKKQAVHPPWERFTPLVHVLKCWDLREMSIILSLQVIQVFLVFGFGIVNPCGTNCNYKKVNGMLEWNRNKYKKKRTAWDTNVIAVDN